ncbi:MAG: TSUP family transporter, partial [Paracoccaceae bacterium]
MIENLASAFREAVAMGGFPLLVFASVLAGLVRGFTGFGKAMVFIPFAGAVLPPVWAVTTVLVFDLIGPLPNVPRALRDGAPMDVLRLAGGAILGLPIGLFLLFRIEPDVFRWMVSIV